MSKPHDYPKADVSQLSTRPIKLPNSRNGLEGDLYEWLIAITQLTGQPPENGVSAATMLMATAQDSIDVLMQAPPSMAIGDPSGKRTVHVHFLWGRFTAGEWYIKAVSFGIDASRAEMALARQRAVKEHLLDKAELENSRHVHLRQAVFPAESHWETWPREVQHGDRIIEEAIKTAYEHASEDAEALENPITWVDMALDLASLGVGHITGPKFTGAEKLEHMGKQLTGEAGTAYKILTQSPVARVALEEERALLHIEALELAHKTAELGREDYKAYQELKKTKESKGDRLLYTAVDYASMIPIAGPFIRTFAGMFFNIAIASDAARVTRIRSRLYVWFVAGYVRQLALADTGEPKLDRSHGKLGEAWFRWDKKYFDLGVKKAPLPGGPGQFAAQASLMHYAAEHYTNGGWGGLGFRPHNWQTLDDFIVNWSPELLARALATQLHTRKNLTE
jgi:hypothetical protein